MGSWLCEKPRIHYTGVANVRDQLIWDGWYFGFLGSSLLCFISQRIGCSESALALWSSFASFRVQVGFSGTGRCIHLQVSDYSNFHYIVDSYNGLRIRWYAPQDHLVGNSSPMECGSSMFDVSALSYLLFVDDGARHACASCVCLLDTQQDPLICSMGRCLTAGADDEPHSHDQALFLPRPSPTCLVRQVRSCLCKASTWCCIDCSRPRLSIDKTSPGRSSWDKWSQSAKVNWVPSFYHGTHSPPSSR
mgnify:CR=1 FL=1